MTGPCVPSTAFFPASPPPTHTHIPLAATLVATDLKVGDIIHLGAEAQGSVGENSSLSV